MNQRSSLSSRICGTAALVLLTCGARTAPCGRSRNGASRTDISAAACTPAEERGPDNGRAGANNGRPARTAEEQIRTAEEQLRTAPSDDRSKRARHLAPRGRSQHTFFANAGYTAILSTIYLRESSSGSLNEGLEITADTTGRRAGVWASASSIRAGSSRPGRGGFERTSRIHYIAPEFVARQRVGRRWLFRESAGIGYGRYIRGYAGLTGSRGGVGIHESVSAEFMLTRFLGLGVTVGGQWLIVDSPDVDDGAELNLAGIFRVQLGGGIRFYF